MKLTLDDINQKTESKYESLEIEAEDGRTVKLRNPLRLPKFERDKLIALSKSSVSEEESEEQDEKEADEADEVETLERLKALLLIPADHKDVLEDIFKVWGDDLAVYVTVVGMYMEGAQVGEASPSQD